MDVAVADGCSAEIAPRRAWKELAICSAAKEIGATYW